jgi:polysaccharide export outer membrane protein
LSVSSLNNVEDALYNSVNAAAAGYEVDNNGEIHVHHLGKINVQGLTRKQLKIKLEKELDPYLKDPVVIVSFLNHHITIIGSVGNPQIFPMPNEKVSIIDALANSGSVVPFTNLSNVIIIRDSSDDKKQIRQVNLEDNSVFNSEFFYLKPNDVVVVKPDEKELLKQQKRTDYQQVSSIVLQTITISLIIYNTFFRK